MNQSVGTRLAGWPTAFGVSGLLWIVAQYVAFGFNTSLPMMLAIGFVTVAVLALAWLPSRVRDTLAGLWLLAVALNTLWLSQMPGEGGLLLDLYAGALVGSVLFGLWAVLAVVVLVHMPERSLPKPQQSEPADERSAA